MKLNKINIVGGGPAGLYFAILMREYYPESQITIYERNSVDDLEGWGIVIIQGTVRLLEKCDPDSYQEIVDQCKRWSDVVVWHNGEQMRVRGKEYISTSRNLLVAALRKRCATLGIEILYDQEISDISEIAECDLLVGADGASSAVRDARKESFGTKIDLRKHWFVWLGTRRIFDTITHISRSTPTGGFTAECYQYSDGHSSFIPNCSDKTWRASGFDEMSMEEAIQFLSEVFKEELDGQPLLMNEGSHWRQFPHITNENWSHDNILLLGDALRTAHFSIGSGTRLAIEDAIVAAQALSRNETVTAAFEEFEKRRRPLMERLQGIAFESMLWFESIDERIDLEIVPFTYEIMTRTSSLGERSLKLTDPDFLKIYQDYKHGKELPA
jgi:anthraniloyl-CoA monooxygenase